MILHFLDFEVIGWGKACDGTKYEEKGKLATPRLCYQACSGYFLFQYGVKGTSECDGSGCRCRCVDQEAGACMMKDSQEYDVYEMTNGKSGLALG